MHDLCPGQGTAKGGKNAVLQDINIPALAACVGHALTTTDGSLASAAGSVAKICL